VLDQNPEPTRESSVQFNTGSREQREGQFRRTVGPRGIQGNTIAKQKLLKEVLQEIVICCGL
jgi:hypothetical protein